MKTTTKITLSLFIVAMAVFAVFARTSMAEEEKYIVALPMIEGFEDTSLVDVIEQIVGVLEKKIDREVEFKMLLFRHDENLFDKVQAAFDKKEADISYINGRDHGEMQLDGKPNYEVLAVLGMNKSTVEKGCFFSRTGEFSDISEARGKKWMGSGTVIPRFVLYKNDIDEPMESFFEVKGFESDSPIIPMIEKLKSGEIDVLSTYYHTMWLTGELKKKEPELEVLACEPMESHWVFVARPGLPPERIKQFSEMLVNSHKDPDFKQFGFAFMMIDGRFMPMGEKTAALNREYARIVRDNKWRDEEKEFFKKYFKQK